MSVLGQEIPQQITEILDRQQQDWNEGNIRSFMKGYWESDSLMFVGKSGITYGYQNTLQRYLRTYPDRKAMGTLSFDLLEFQSLGVDRFLVIGKWTLDRENDVLEGYFSLIWRKIENQWRIVVDHSS
jgi:hypothetical protein